MKSLLPWIQGLGTFAPVFRSGFLFGVLAACGSSPDPGLGDDDAPPAIEWRPVRIEALDGPAGRGARLPDF